MEISKKDWKLFREKLPGWQEAYMERLDQEYIELLSDSEAPASERFWKLWETIKTDKRRPGVIVEMRRSNMVNTLIGLLRDGAIEYADLDDFSDDVKEAVKRISSAFDE